MTNVCGCLVGACLATALSAFSPLPVAASAITSWGPGSTGMSVPEISSALAVAADYNHALVLLPDRTLVQFGNDSYLSSIPAEAVNIQAIATGKSHSLALRSDGTVVCWGKSTEQQTTPPQGLQSVVDVAAGDFFSAALKSNGDVVLWGEWWDGSETVRNPSLPPDVTNIVAIAAGQNHVVLVKRDGTVRAFGCNNAGQCDVPEGLSNVKSVAAGALFTLAIKNDGHVVAWGTLGNFPPEGLGGIRAIAAGYSHALGVKNDGTVLAWGSGDAAVVPPGLADVQLVAAGSDFNIALVKSTTSISSVTMQDRTIKVIFQISPGLQCTVQRCSSPLFEAEAVVDLLTTNAPASGQLEFAEPVASAGNAFYRLKF